MSTTTDTYDTEVQRVADEAVRQARAFDGWTAYEAAKAHVCREHPEALNGRYDDIIDAIKTHLDI